jgi:hypothetical protein
MTAIYRIDKSRRIVFSQATGRVTDEILLQHQRRLSTDPDFEPDYRQLYDFRDVEDLQATSTGVRELAINNQFGRGAQRALIAGSEAVYGVARMFQIMAEKGPDRIEVFYSLEEALDWLGLEDWEP